MPTPFRALTLATALAAASFLLPHFSFSQTWLGGGGNNNLTNADNWEDGVVPASGTNANLLILGGTGLVNDTGTTFSLRSLDLYSLGAGFTVSGSPLLFTGDLPFISNSTNFLGRFTADVIVGAPLTLAGASYLVFEGAFTDPGNFGLTVTNTQALTELAGTFQLGNVSVQNAAYLNFTGNGTLAGVIQGFGSSVIAFGGSAANSRTLAAGSSLRSDEGLIQFLGGTTLFEGTSFVGPADFEILGGTVDGSGNIDFNLAPTDVFTFNNGAILGSAGQYAAVNGGNVQFNGIAGLQRIGRELILRSPDIRFITGTLQLEQNGLLTIDGTTAQIRASDFALTGAGPGNLVRLTNGSVLQKTSDSGSGTFTLEAPLSLGNGTLRVDAGTVRLNAGSTMPAGSTLQAAFITEIDFASGTHALNGVNMVGEGNIVVSGATAVTDPNLTPDLGSVIGSLELRGGTLTGGNFNLVSPATSWNASTLSTTFAAPAVATTIVPTFLALTGSTTRLLDRRSIFASGGGNWVGGDLQISGGDAANPAFFALTGSGGTIFQVQSDQSILPGPGGNARFVINSGNRFIKSVNTGTTTISVPIGNSGGLEVNSGRVLLTEGTGGLSIGGGLTTAAGGTLEFGSGSFQLNFPSWFGNGAFVLSGGTLTAPGGNVGAGAARLDLTDGTVSGGNLVLLGAPINWAATRLATNFTAPTVAFTNVNGPLNLIGNSTHVLDHRSLFLSAGGSWTGGDLEIGGGIVTGPATFSLTGSGGAIFRIQSDRTVALGANGNGFFVVNGGNRLIKDTTSGSTILNVPFANSGGVEINTGRLLLNAGTGTGSIAGNLSTVTGATLEFGAGSFQLNFPAWFGNGAYILSGGTLIAPGGNVGAGSARFDLTDGTLSGGNFVLLGAPINWAATRLATNIPTPNVAFTNVNSPLNLIGNSTHVLERRSLFVAAGGTWTGGDLEIGGGNVGNPAFFSLTGSGGTIFRIQSDQTATQGPGGNGSFVVNSGNRLIKDTTSGSTILNVPFANSGGVEINTGRLLLNAGTGTGSIAGNLSTVTGATLEFGAGSFQLNFPAWFGNGAFVLSGGTLIAPGGNVGAGSARFDLTDGTLSGGNFVLLGAPINWAATRLATNIPTPNVAFTNVNSPLNLIGNSTHVLERRSLFLAAGGAWTGGNLEIGGGNAGNPAFFSLTGSGGTIFRIQSDQTATQGPGGNGSFVVNSGNRLIKDTTSGSTTLNVPFANAGGVEINTGRLLLNAGTGTGSIAGNLSTVTGATLEFGAGSFQLNFPAWFGNGAFVLSGGTVIAPGGNMGAGSARLDLTDGTLSGGNFVLLGAPINWAATRLATSIPTPNVAFTNVNSPLNLVGTGTHVLERRSLFLGAGGTWTGGDLEIGGGDAGNPALFSLAAGGTTFRMQCDNTIGYGAVSSATVFVAPGALLLKDTTSGTTRIDPCLTNNGTIEVASGTLNLTATCSTNNGLLQASSGGTLRVEGNISGTGNVTVTKGGTLALLGGLSNSGQNSISGTLDLRNGFFGNVGGSTTINIGGRVTGGGLLYGTIVNNGTISTNENIAFSGPVTNNGTMRFRAGGRAQFYGPTFVNNGVFDVITGLVDFYNGTTFVNNGIVLDSSVVKVKRTTKAGNTVSIVVDGYAEHVFALLYSPDLQTEFIQIGATQIGTGSELTFVDTNNGAKGFYRVIVDPSQGGLGNRPR